jgi:hypothetical protein
MRLALHGNAIHFSRVVGSFNFHLSCLHLALPGKILMEHFYAAL